ncbi:hypothetical protein PIB30_036184 [Stylosanthes scabra]|uniref:FAF domain-containing protein n=1 Tax=Stylosanthes scabra TaxID=79078 RepID=A0ABU6RDY7_9FABA|nr:hypothetical protein [Stylosanthes scabra]
MDILRDFLPSKVKRINSTLYSKALLWKSKVPAAFSMKIFHCKKCYRYQPKVQVGLKTLAVIHQEEKLPYKVLHSYTIAPSEPACGKPLPSLPLPPPPPPLPPPPLPPSMWLSCSYAFRCTMIGDVLGAESGDYMTFEGKPEAEAQEEEEEAKHSSLIRIQLSKGKEKIEEEKKRELQFPPPITLIRTHTGEMPWVFKRECRDEGRLVITTEKAKKKRREYVEALRANGNVTMKLVTEDEEEESEYCEECGCSMNEEEEEEKRVEFEDLEFNHEEEEKMEEEGDFELEVEEEGYNSNLWDRERALCWDFGECSVGVGDSNGFLGPPGSGPTHFRPITPVM